MSIQIGIKYYTSVSSEVFPEPLGPIRSIDGKVVSPLALKTTEWRKIGIERTSRSAMTSPIGEGLNIECTKSEIVDILRYGSGRSEARGTFRHLETMTQGCQAGL